jgi:superfamily II RNA helicase
MVKIFDKEFPNDLEKTYTEYFKEFPYELSAFQKHSIRSLVEGHNSLVTIPTGGGKTTPAEFAINYFTKLGKRVIYASPIKALSNQKYHDFVLKFKDISIGILTGDIKSNPTADVVIMTAEILHNQLQNNHLEGSISSESGEIDQDIGCIIFDEIHYINDADRGNVWEESIAMICAMQKAPQLLMLSATIASSDLFAEWIENIGTKEVWIASSNVRVVPLTHYIYLTCGNLKKIKDEKIKKLIDAETNTLKIIKKEKGKVDMAGIEQTKKVQKLFHTFEIQTKRQFIISSVCAHMRDNNMLPCIIFVFSRKQVVACAQELSLNFQEPDVNIEKECESIIRHLPNYKEYLHLVDYVELVNLLKKGIAIHHGGMLSILREIVEIMFSKGYVKVLFATETFAAGINLPVKTTVFTQLDKYTDDGRRNLYPHEYTQMAGRAGRRGIDPVGNVVHLPNLYRGIQPCDYKTILSNVPQTLASKLKISYNIVLNFEENSLQNSEQKSIIQKSIIQKSIIQKSMFQMEIDRNIINLTKKLNDIQTDIDLFSTKEEELWEKYRVMVKDLEKLPKKQKQKHESNIRNLLITYPRIKELNNLALKYYDTKLDIECKSNWIDRQVSIIKTILKENDFIRDDVDANNEIKKTTKGIIATKIKKVNPLLFATLINNRHLHKLTTEGIVAVLSCFTRSSKNESYPTNDFGIDKITELNQYYESLELEHELYTGIDYNMNYELIDPILNWCAAKNEQSCKEILHSMDISSGDFVKAVLEITNISEELYKACEYIGDTELCSKLEQIPELVLKYIASPQSLYI